VLDHFLLSRTLYSKSVDRVTVFHDIDNLSDHEPIVLDLSLNIHCVGFPDRIYTPRVSWVKATDNNLRAYQSTLILHLNSIDVPTDVLLCNDVKCSNLSHLQRLNRYAVEITESCLHAAEATIPLTCKRQTGGRIPWWSERVQPLRDKSLFWHNPMDGLWAT